MVFKIKENESPLADLIRKKSNPLDWLVSEYLHGMLVFSISIIILLMAWNGWFKPTMDKPELWFQRSGALLVGIAIYVELKILKGLSINETIPLDNEKQHTQAEPKDLMLHLKEVANDGLAQRNIKMLKVYGYIPLFLGFVGTIVWGYGDLIFYYIHN